MKLTDDTAPQEKNEKAAEPDHSTAEINKVLALSVTGLTLHIYSWVYSTISLLDLELARYLLQKIVFQEDSEGKRVLLAAFAQGALKQQKNHHGAERRRWRLYKKLLSMPSTV